MLTLSQIIDRLASEARKRNIELPDKGSVLDEMSAPELIEARHAFKQLSRDLLDSITDDAADAEVRKIEKLHALAMTGWDVIRDEEELRSARNAEDEHRARQRPTAGDMTVPGVDDGRGGYSSRSHSGWATKDGTEVRVLSRRDSFASDRSEYRGPSLGAILRAMVTGPRDDAERRALAEGTDSAGGYTVPDPLAAQFIDKLRAASVCMAAGAKTVPMTSDTLAIARLETDPTMAWRAENAAVGESDPTFGRVSFQARSLAGLVRASRELLEDSVNVAPMLENAFIQSTALAFDLGCLYGTGADDQPEGLGVTAGINSVSMGTNGAALTDYDEIIDMIYEMQVDNAGDPSAMIYHPRTGAALAKLKDTQNNPLTVPEMVAKVPKLTTTSVPIDQTQGTAVNASSILSGDFSRMLIGLRNSLRIELLKERYADQLQYGFVAFMRGDVQFEHKASFTKLIGIIP